MPAQIGPGAGFGIEPEFALALGLVGPMASVAAVGEDRPDVAIEFDARGRGRANTRGRHTTPHCETSKPPAHLSPSRGYDAILHPGRAGRRRSLLHPEWACRDPVRFLL